MPRSRDIFGEVRGGRQRNAAWMLTAACFFGSFFGCRREDPPPPVVEPGSARIVRFDVSSTSVHIGEAVTISWKTENVVDNMITTESGALIQATTDQGGFVESAPLTENTVFILRATGEDGADAVAMTSVTIIEVPSEVTILQFAASALAIRSGERSVLSWEVSNATSLSITRDENAVYETDETFLGNKEISPEHTSTYTLTVQGAGGPKSQQLTVVVDQTPPPPPPSKGACADDPRGPGVAWFEEAVDAMPRPITPPGTSFFGSGGGLADLDGDGDLDLVLASRGAPVVVLKNIGGMKFEEVPGRAGIDSRSPSAGVSLGDLDGDGDTDLLLLGIQQTFLYQNAGDGTFSRVLASAIDSQQPAESALLADLDRDGRLEIILNIFGRDLTDEALRGDRLLRSNNGFAYTDVSADADFEERGQTWTSVAFDADRDGHLDVHLANDTFSQDYGSGLRWDTPLAHDRLFLNRTRGALRFADGTTSFGLEIPHSSMGAIAGDFDSDGRLDLYISNLGKNPLYLGKTSGPFVEAAEELGVAGIRRNNEHCAQLDPDCLLVSWGAVLEDFDNDGLSELIVVNGALSADRAQPTLLYTRVPGSGPVRYEERDPGLGCIDGRALLPGDLDGDGDLDLVVIARNEPVRVYSTRAPAENGSLRVQLRGHASNKQGIGALVTLELDDGTKQIRAIGSGGMVHSSRPPEAHFGLGRRIPVLLTVEWPSGQVQSYTPSAGEHVLSISEP